MKALSADYPKYVNPTSGIAPALTLEINHPDLAAPVHIVNDTDDFPFGAAYIYKTNTHYPVGAIVTPSAYNGHYYKVTAAGLSGSVEPTFPTGSGSTLIDNTVTFQEAGYLYKAVGFELIPPDDLEQGLPEASLRVDNVGHELTDLIETTKGGRGATMTVREMFRGTPYVENLLPYSEQLDQWTVMLGATVTPNADTAPDGSATADVVNDTDTANNSYIKRASVTLSAWQIATGSLHVKQDAVLKGTRFCVIRLNFTGGASGDSLELRLDTSSGELFSYSAGSSKVLLDYGAVLDRGYWRIYLIGYSGDAAVTAAELRFYPAAGKNFVYQTSVTGSATAWGGQINRGALIDYIKTDASPIVDDPQSPVAEWEFTMGLRQVAMDAKQVTGKLGYDNPFNRPAITAIYTPTTAPGLY